MVSKLTGTPVPTGVYEGFLARQAAKSNKNPAAVALGKLGGKKGGVARAKALTQKQRSEIAKKGAKVRWERSAEILKLIRKGVPAQQVAKKLGLPIEKVRNIRDRAKPETKETTLKALH